jgi:hypothetical protein
MRWRMVSGTDLSLRTQGSDTGHDAMWRELGVTETEMGKLWTEDATRTDSGETMKR